MDDHKTNGLRQFDITGAPFTGDPTKWDDIKGAVCTAATANNVSFLIENGMHLFKCRQALNADPNDNQATAYFRDHSNANVVYVSMNIQVVKATISETAAQYMALRAEDQLALQRHNVATHVKRANQILLEALRKYFLTKKQRALSDQLQRALDSPVVKNAVAMDFSDWMDNWAHSQYWRQPAVRAWADILDVFQGKERSSINSFWGSLSDAAGSCNQQRKKPAQYSAADSAIEMCLKSLKEACGNDADRMVERLHCEIRMHLFRDLARKPTEGLAWDQALRDGVKAQRQGNFTRQKTKDAADGALSLIAQGSGAYQTADAASNAPTPPRSGARKDSQEAKAMKAWVNQQIDKKLKGGEQAPTKEEREHCTICNKTHAGGAKSCRYRDNEKPTTTTRGRPSTPRRGRGSGRRTASERRAMQAAASLRQNEESDDSASGSCEENEHSENYVYASLTPDHARTSRSILIARGIQALHPDTQAEVSISPYLQHVAKLHGRIVKLKGVVGDASLPAQVADLVFHLRTATGGAYRLAIKASGLYHPDAHAAIIAHDDIEAAGLRVDYTTGCMRTPNGDTIKMAKRNKVWVAPLVSMDDQTVLAASITPPASPSADAAETAAVRAHQCSMHAGATSMCRMYDVMHGAGFGKASKAALCKTAKSCVACAIGKGVADYRTHAVAAPPSKLSVRFVSKPLVRTTARWISQDATTLAGLRASRHNERNRPAIERALSREWAEIDITSESTLRLHLTVPEARLVRDEVPRAVDEENGHRSEVPLSEVRPTARRSRTSDTEPILRSARRRLSAPPTRNAALPPTSSGEPKLHSVPTSGAGEHPPSHLGEHTPGAGTRTPHRGMPSDLGEPPSTTLDEQERTAMPSRRSRAMARHLGILKRVPEPGEEWLLDWAVMGQETLGNGGEQYALVVMDAGSDLVFIKPTTTRDRVWEHLEEVAALWGRLPTVIRCDNGAEFVKDKMLKAWRRKHFIALRATQPHRHKMQGKIENLIRNMKQRCRATRLGFGGPARLWPELTRMFEAIHNIMPRQVPKHHVHAGKSPQAIYKPANLHYDAERLWHPPGCHAVGKLSKEDPLVTDTSNGARGVEGIFLGCDRTAPRVRMYVPKYRKFMEFRDVAFFDDRLPFRDGLLDNTGFSAAEIAAMHTPLGPTPTRASPRASTSVESSDASDAPTEAQARADDSMPETTDPVVEDSEDRDVASASPPSEHLITDVNDATLARFAAERCLPLHLPAVSFYDDGWDVECSGTAKHQGKQFIVAKHVSCTSNPALTQRWKNRDLELPVSRPHNADRDVSLRRAIQLTYPDIVTMQQLVRVCKHQTPFPATEGEKQAIREAKEVARRNSIQIKGRELPASTKILTLDDASLARAIVHHAKPLQLNEEELVQPTGMRRNKGRVTIEYRFISPNDKAARGNVGTIPVSPQKEGDASVRDVLNHMHDFPDTLQDIGLHGKTAQTISKAHTVAWQELIAGWKSVGPHTTAWMSENSPEELDDDEFRDNPFSDDQLASRWAMLTDIETLSREESMDLSWIDLTEPDPRHRGQAMRNPRLAPIWQLEEDNEMKGLWERGCLRKVNRSDLPADARVISSRFHYKIKRSHAGEAKLKVKRLKVRLVVQGQNMSREKGDFDNAFSPVPHLAGVRTVMSIATAQGWKARSVDFTQGFIQADLPKDGKPIYISPPPGVEEEEGVVYQVLRPLYGMPHSGRCLHVTWSNWLKSEGFSKVGYEGSMWAKNDGEDTILIATHVDDSIVTGSSPEKLDAFIDRLKSRFDATAEMDVSDFLGMEWERDVEGRTSRLHQKAFLEKLLKDYGYWEVRAPPVTPMVPKAKLSAEDQPDVADPVLHRKYRSIVGALGWLSNGTRPDISHTYSELSKYVQRPGVKHMEAAEHCLRYLSGTVDLFITYRGDADQRDGQERNTLWGWVDADYAADLNTRRSHTGYVLMLNGGPVSWKSTRQKSVSLSTAESEWYAASEAGKEILYLRFILHDFGFSQKGPTPLYEDSRAVICMSENPVNRKASRHIDTRRYFIGELVADKLIKLVTCRTDKMVADALTKSLPGPAFRQHRSRMMGTNDAPYSAMLCRAQVG